MAGREEHCSVRCLSSVVQSISGENNFLFPMRLDEGGSYEEIILNFQLISIYLKTYKKALSTAPELIHYFNRITLTGRRKVIRFQHSSDFSRRHNKKLEETQLGDSELLEDSFRGLINFAFRPRRVDLVQ